MTCTVTEWGPSGLLRWFNGELQVAWTRIVREYPENPIMKEARGGSEWTETDWRAVPTVTELPFQTYERILHETWPGGTSERVVHLLKSYGIKYEPGSAEANLALQAHLIGNSP